MDVLLFQTVEGGEVRCENGQMTLTGGLETAAYLSLFGGNVEDSGLAADVAKQWWANWSEPDRAAIYRSELQFLLATLPLIPANLQRFEEAATADLQWLTQSAADSVAARAVMPGINTVRIDVAVVINGETTKFSITPPKQA